MHSLFIRRQLSCLDKAFSLTKPSNTAILCLSYSANATNHNLVAWNSLCYFNSPITKQAHNIILINNRRFLCENIKPKSEEKGKTESEKMGSDEEKGKKPSKFRVFYRQYGPSFLVIHMSTVVAILYVFFLISKQGYDITQLLVVFEKFGFMTPEKVKSIHERIDNYKPETLKGFITGENIKHFATAYVVYKIITPFRYMLSIALTRSFVHKLRAKGYFRP